MYGSVYVLCSKKGWWYTKEIQALVSADMIWYRVRRDRPFAKHLRALESALNFTCVSNSISRCELFCMKFRDSPQNTMLMHQKTCTFIGVIYQLLVIIVHVSVLRNGSSGCVSVNLSHLLRWKQHLACYGLFCVRILMTVTHHRCRTVTKLLTQLKHAAGPSPRTQHPLI